MDCQPIEIAVAFPTGSVVIPTGIVTTGIGCCTVTENVTKLPSLRFSTTDKGLALFVIASTDTGKLLSVTVPVAVTPVKVEFRLAPVRPVLWSDTVVATPSIAALSAVPVVGGVPVCVTVTLILGRKFGSCLPTIVTSCSVFLTCVGS